MENLDKKSDVVVKQFIDMLGKNIDDKFQNYLDGKNKWKTPIMEKDIISIKYGFNAFSSSGSKFVQTGILLIHKLPNSID